MSIKNHLYCTQDEKNPDDVCDDCFPYIPTFKDWWQELSSEKEIELACQFYKESIGPIQADISPDNAKMYELALDAEAFMIDMIRECSFAEPEWVSFLKEQYEEEKGEE